MKWSAPFQPLSSSAIRFFDASAKDRVGRCLDLWHKADECLLLSEKRTRAGRSPVSGNPKPVMLRSKHARLRDCAPSRLNSPSISQLDGLAAPGAVRARRSTEMADYLTAPPVMPLMKRSKKRL